MEAIILAAGEGSRMGDITQDLPKIFLDISGKKLYRHQIEQLAPYCDRITIVLGHGFENLSNPAQKFSIDRSGLNVDINFKIIEDWKSKENAYTASSGLQNVHDDVLLICGDVIFTQEAIHRFVTQFRDNLKPSGFSAVGVVEGVQDDMTAVRWDEEGVITKYGAIEGHQEVGMFALHSDYISEARSILQKNPEDWFPIIFQEIPTKRVTIDRNNRHEINTRQHLREAREKWEKHSSKTISDK